MSSLLKGSIVMIIEVELGVWMDTSSAEYSLIRAQSLIWKTARCMLQAINQKKTLRGAAVKIPFLKALQHTSQGESRLPGAFLIFSFHTHFVANHHQMFTFENSFSAISK